MKKIYICTNKSVAIGRPSCGMRGSEETLKLLKQKIAEYGLEASVEPITCLGHCHEGPSLRVAGGDFYLGASADKIDELMDWLEKELP